jgi:hypothetical protein
MHSRLFYVRCKTLHPWFITCHYGFQDMFTSSAIHQWRKTALSKRHLLCSAVRHLGNQRTHTLRYTISSWTVLLTAYIFDGQLPMRRISPNFDSSLFQNLFLHSCSIHIGHFWPTVTILVIAILSTIFEISLPFSDMWYYNHAITTRLKNWQWISMMQKCFAYKNRITYLLIPWSRVLLEQLTSNLCN